MFFHVWAVREELVAWRIKPIAPFLCCVSSGRYTLSVKLSNFTV